MYNILIVKDDHINLIKFILIKNPELKILYCNENYITNLSRLCEEGIEYPRGTPLAAYNSNPQDKIFFENLGEMYEHKFNLNYKIYEL